MTHARIARQQVTPESWFVEGCHIMECWNSPDDDAASLARVRVEPGGVTRWHRLHDTVERYVILEGEGKVEVGELAEDIVRPGDVVVIPAGTAQRIANVGDGDLLFLALCTPRFRVDLYEDIDDAPMPRADAAAP